MTTASVFFLALVPILISYYAREYEFEDERDFQKERENPGCEEETFDFIIVGGGTAGCVVARRLVDAKFKVLILEAGGTPPPITRVVMATPLFTQEFSPEVTYYYNSIGEKYTGQSTNGVMFLPAGKMLGGGSSHNLMIYQRGSPYTYDGWAKDTGDKSWRYKNILKYWRKFENYQGNFSHIHNGQHGTGGPITITSPYYRAADVWFAAGKELGYKFTDNTGPQTVGFNPPAEFAKHGYRQSSYFNYIQPIENSMKEYLTIRRYSPVNKILFDGKKAIGVEYERHGVKMTAKVSTEVILSAGAFISPIILIKSGIGPKDEIETAGVTQIVELPKVGRNLQDHVTVMIGPFHMPEKKQRWSLEGDLTEEELNYILFRGRTIPANAGAFIASSRAKKQNPIYPDLQLYYNYQTLYNDSNACWVVLARPKSRGYIKVNNSATSMTSNDLPIIHMQYLSERSDEDVLIEGINFCFKALEETAAFKQIGATFAGQPVPGCENLTFRSEEYWRCYIHHTAYVGWHASGTCRMGKRGDFKNSVVDSKLRVHGVTHLRVIDNSIMPKIIAGNTAGPAYMIGEKMAAEICEEYGR